MLVACALVAVVLLVVARTLVARPVGILRFAVGLAVLSAAAGVGLDRELGAIVSASLLAVVGLLVALGCRDDDRVEPVPIGVALGRLASAPSGCEPLAAPSLCYFCGEAEGSSAFKGHPICERCRAKLERP